MTRSLPPVIVTGSRLLREQVSIAERHCGLDFDYYDTIPDARRYAIRREAVILGGDLITRTRKPWRCRGVVLAANIGPWTSQMTTYAERAGACYVIDLPTGLPVFIEAIWQAHRNLHTRLHR
ncbi:MAG TPA: hypothetical protein VF657_09005 [Actinoplanes sp.]